MFAFALKRKRKFDEELGAKKVVKKKPTTRRISGTGLSSHNQAAQLAVRNNRNAKKANNSASRATNRTPTNWLGTSTRNTNSGNRTIYTDAQRNAMNGMTDEYYRSEGTGTGSTISLFTFGWTGVSKKDTYTSLFSLKEYHDRFNQKIVAAFPKLINAVPFTSYTDRTGGGYISESQITATAETNLSPNATREKVIQLAKDAGFTGDLARVEFSQKTIKQIQNGETLVLPKGTVNPNTITRTRNQTNTRNSNSDVIPTGNAPTGFMNTIFGDGFGEGFGSALGLSAPVVILIAVVIGIIVLKK